MRVEFRLGRTRFFRYLSGGGGGGGGDLDARGERAIITDWAGAAGSVVGRGRRAGGNDRIDGRSSD